MPDARSSNTAVPPSTVIASAPPERPLRPTVLHSDDVLVAVHDIAVQVSCQPLISADNHPNGGLEAVAAHMAGTATDRLGDLVLTFVPSTRLTGAANTPDLSPDLSIPVRAGAESPPVGHLHLRRGDGVTPGPADTATVALLARLAVAEHLHRRSAAHPAVSTDDNVAELRQELANAREQISHLHEALASNRDIGVAIGVIVATERTTPEAGFDRLRTASQNTNRKLRDIAADVVYTGVLPPPTPPTPPALPTPVAPHSAATAFTVGGTAERSDGGRTNPRRHHIDVTVRRDRITVDLAGEVDLAARADLSELLRRVEPLPVPVHLRAHLVTFADCHGIEPLLDAMFSQTADDQPRFVLDTASGPLRRALTLGGLHDHHIPPGRGRPRLPAAADHLEAARTRWAAADAAFDAALDEHVSMAELREHDEELDAAMKAYTAAEQHRDSQR